MTPQEINEAVARKLGYDAIDKSHRRPIPDYCHSIEAAWEIWAKMSDGYFLTLETEAGTFGRNIVKVWKNDGKGDSGWVIDDVYANTAPMAICLAFLKMEEK